MGIIVGEVKPPLLTRVDTGITVLYRTGSPGASPTEA